MSKDKRLKILEKYNIEIANGLGIKELKELQVKVKKVRCKNYYSVEDADYELAVYALKKTLLECISEMIEEQE